jgi:hypothetical protein
VVIAHRHPNLLVADEWAARHSELLAACYSRFCQDGEWPQIEQLQHDFELENRSVDAWAVAWSIPNALGFVERERLVLRVRALSHVPAAGRLLEDWCTALRLAYRRWRSDPAARFTRGDVLAALDGDLPRTRAVSMLLLRESWAFGSGSGDADHDWDFELTSRVRPARDVRTANDLLAARDTIEFPPIPSEPPPATPPSSEATTDRRSRLHVRAWRYANDNQVVAGVVTAVVLTAGGALIALLAGVIGHHEPPAAKRPPSSHTSAQYTAQHVATVKEQAGSGGARTFAQPRALSGEGDTVKPGQVVRVRCKLYSPDPPSVRPDGYWYQLASAPWNGRYYAPANSFWNGDVPGHRPYTHNTDFSVPDC